MYSLCLSLPSTGCAGAWTTYLTGLVLPWAGLIYLHISQSFCSWNPLTHWVRQVTAAEGSALKGRNWEPPAANTHSSSSCRNWCNLQIKLSGQISNHIHDTIQVLFRNPFIPLFAMHHCLATGFSIHSKWHTMACFCPFLIYPSLPSIHMHPFVIFKSLLLVFLYFETHGFIFKNHFNT